MPQIRKSGNAKLKILVSKEDCPQQSLHKDDDKLAKAPGRKVQEDLIFSMIIALEDDVTTPTTIEVENGGIKIPRGYAIIFRGDFPHGGGAYNKRNIRLFISIGTSAYPHKGTFVVPHEPKEKKIVEKEEDEEVDKEEEADEDEEEEEGMKRGKKRSNVSLTRGTRFFFILLFILIILLFICYSNLLLLSQLLKLPLTRRNLIKIFHYQIAIIIAYCF